MTETDPNGPPTAPRATRCTYVRDEHLTRAVGRSSGCVPPSRWDQAVWRGTTTRNSQSIARRCQRPGVPRGVPQWMSLGGRSAVHPVGDAKNAPGSRPEQTLANTRKRSTALIGIMYAVVRGWRFGAMKNYETRERHASDDPDNPVQGAEPSNQLWPLPEERAARGRQPATFACFAYFVVSMSSQLLGRNDPPVPGLWAPALLGRVVFQRPAAGSRAARSPCPHRTAARTTAAPKPTALPLSFSASGK